MSPTSIDLLTWALLATILSKLETGAAGGVWTIIAVSCVIAGFIVHQRETSR